MSAPSIPRWPEGLREDTPLPFRLWRVLNLVDGQRSLDELGRSLQLTHADIVEALDTAARRLSCEPAAPAVRAQPVAPPTPLAPAASSSSPPLNDAMIDAVSACLVATVGPMGDVLVEEALDDLPEHATLEQLLRALGSDMKEPALGQFAARLRLKGLA